MSALAGQTTAGLKRYRRGTDRILAPEATLARVRPLLPVMGITRIANVTGLDRIGIPVIMVSRPNARSISVSQGKGLELAAAKASGVMEAIETYHAETITLPLKYASFGELCYSHRMIDVAGLPFCANSRWRDDLAMLWIEGRELESGEPIWLPYELVSTNYTLPLPPGSGCFAANTNGLASGNSLAEAICHGLCELIERDATTLWRVRSAAARRVSAIDPATIEDVDCRDMLGRFERANIAVRIWDVTTDIGVACFQCLVMGSHAQDADPEFGAGCHPRREVALCRALTEAAQARTTYIVGARDDLGSELYQDEVRAHRAKEARELFEERPPAGNFANTPTWEADTVDDDVQEILRHLHQVGLHQAAFIELTKPAFRLPVARVVVPGLEGAFHEVGDYLAGPRALAILGAEGEPT
jgi:ribosomal protein S12 methylthiotransferase accessory factor